MKTEIPVIIMIFATNMWTNFIRMILLANMLVSFNIAYHALDTGNNLAAVGWFLAGLNALGTLMLYDKKNKIL